MQQHNTLEFTYKAKTDILVIFIYTHYPAKNEYVCVYGICTCHGVKYMYNYPIPTQQIDYFWELLKPGTRDPGGILKPGTSKIRDCRYFILKPGTLISGTSFCTASTFR